MSDLLAPLPPNIVFTANADEVTRMRRVAGRSMARAMPWGTYWIVLLGMFIVIGLAVVAAQKTGHISASEVPPVLLAAYLCYACGVVLNILLTRRYSKRAYAADGAITFELAFSDGGILSKTDLIETRVPWQAVRSIQAWPECTLIWIAHSQFYGIPTRLFPDDAAKAAFVKAARARIANAQQVAG
jgi:hypothetical protein